MKIEDQIAAVAREIGMRRSVYPRWVVQKRMTQAKADHELAAMEAALETLKDVSDMYVGYNVSTFTALRDAIEEDSDGG